MCANSEESSETARMRRLAWDIAGGLCDKYHNLMSWPKYMYRARYVQDATIKITNHLQVFPTCEAGNYFSLDSLHANK